MWWLYIVYEACSQSLFLLRGFWEDNRKSLLRFLGESHRGVKGFVKDENFAPIEGASMKVTFRRCIFNLICIWLKSLFKGSRKRCWFPNNERRRVLENSSAGNLHDGSLCRGFCSTWGPVCDCRAESNHAQCHIVSGEMDFHLEYIKFLNFPHWWICQLLSSS